MRLKRYIILFIVFANWQHQNLFANQDSIAVQFIDTIIIQDSRFALYSKSNSNYSIGSDFSKYYTQNSIADLLQYHTPIQILQNGATGVASLNIRGTADDQSNVFWNGVKLNSLSLGSADISLIPINIAQNIEVITNATSTAFGSGNFGAAILLNSKPKFNSGYNVSLRQTFASYKNYKTDFAFTVSNAKIAFSSSSSYQQAENNFKYYDRYKANNPLLRQKHNQLQQWVSVNDLFIKLKKKQTISIGNYTYDKDYQVPSIMGSFENSKKHQDDFGTKTFFNYDRFFRKGKLSLTQNHTYDYLLYTDSTVGLVSKFKTHQAQQTIDYQHQFNSMVLIDVGSSYNFNFAQIKAYKNNKIQHRFAMYAATKFLIKQFNLNLSIRQEVVNADYIRPQFAIAFSFRNKKNFYNTTLSYSDKFRYPDLNDLYWIPGGNINLQPEYGYSTEWQQDFILRKKQHQLEYANTLYFLRIKNNIVWVPMSGGLSTPLNIKRTQHLGTENTLRYTYALKEYFSIKISSNYNYNRSIILEDKSNTSTDGKIIRYKPEHSIKSTFSMQYKYFDLGLNYLYVSKRYTEDENVEVFALRPYHIIDMYVALKYNHKIFNTALVFKVNNLLNTSYESVRSYAQPLRNYQLSILFNFKSKQS
ncbi:MAG: TonB-dependent receptor plug domain-containing protein [Chitinophagales bacterium]|nr:TonB-dependent receptor plug domain-containing protein [Chitinophagales bacterium]HMW93830.1 TonB-dependent receptor plug domain-containing protein [Chitinophagales bacterium]HMY41421.1 TonB-dependent receptor plug domain-containing protein [Chitinophagales bacterium]HMZ94278.1 TonB-dependent receptor plug domain-containing protein [Chitinophagales bacterium]